MIGIRLDAAKSRFLDSRKIQARADRASIRMLGKVGGKTRLRMKHSMRRRKASSQPGEPPSAHVGLIRDFTFYFVDKQAKRVVVGPILLNQKSSESNPATGTLEHGGDAIIRRFDRKRKTFGPPRVVHIEARPFAAPAAAVEFPKAPEYLRGQVR